MKKTADIRLIDEVGVVCIERYLGRSLTGGTDS